MSSAVHATARAEIEIVIEKPGDNRTAHAPEVMGVTAIGDTPKEWRRDVESALAAHVRSVAREDAARAADFARDITATRAEPKAAESRT